MDTVVASFIGECEVHRECTVDDAVIAFKGHLYIKQYTKDKPTKYGIKVFVLADAHNGYVDHIQLYTGWNVQLYTGWNVQLYTGWNVQLYTGWNVQLYTCRNIQLYSGRNIERRDNNVSLCNMVVLDLLE